MNTWRIAIKNLSRQKKRSFLLGSAIAFGVLIITLINGFTGSFVENVGENFAHIFAGHIFIDGVEKTPTGKTLYIVRNDNELIQAIEDLEIEYSFLTRHSEFSGTLIFEGESVRQSIIGIDWEDEQYFTGRLILKDGSFENMQNPRSVILSDKIADKLKLQVGDRMLVQLRTYTGQQNVGEFTLAAIILDPGLVGSISGYANKTYVNELLNLAPDEYMTLGLYLPSMDDIDPTAEALYRRLAEDVDLFAREGEEDEVNPFMAIMQQIEEEEWEGLRYRLYTLNDMLSEVEQIVVVLNTAGLIILLILFIIIMVGITNTFRMVMFERIREIGTMRALGIQKGGIRRLFLTEALWIGLGGALAGLAAAALVMVILSQIFWGLDSPIFILLKNGYMTFRLSFLQTAANLGLVAVLTLLAAFFPADKAAKLQPAVALRTQK
ncbi:MAG: ABC transporter permease [Spirochaetales bacterium]|nr:ABC transporter permease [Spirochaetales bacterium]